MNITEIFNSIHGEVNGHHQGRMVTFIRISGCNCRCDYCDTKHTQDKDYGTEMSIEEIIQKVKDLKTRYVCLTGGEPLLNQEKSLKLVRELWMNRFHISIETNGTIDIKPFYSYVESFVVDYKVGVEGYIPFNETFLNLKKQDVIKFVVDKKSFNKAIENYSFFESYYRRKFEKPIFAFSPIISENFNALDLYKKLKEEDIHNVLVSLQIHKFAGFQ